MTTRRFHHAQLPGHSTLLSGRVPPDEVGFASDRLQVWWNNTPTGWVDEHPHHHTSSDEMFVVLEGTIVVEVNGAAVSVEAGEFCCFPAGLVHQIVKTVGPLRTLMLRSPSVDDKVVAVE